MTTCCPHCNRKLTVSLQVIGKSSEKVFAATGVQWTGADAASLERVAPPSTPRTSILPPLHKTLARIGQATVAGGLLGGLMVSLKANPHMSLVCGLGATTGIFYISLVGMDFLEFITGIDWNRDGTIAGEEIDDGPEIIERHVPYRSRTSERPRSRNIGNTASPPSPGAQKVILSTGHKVRQVELWSFLLHAFEHKWSREYWEKRGLSQKVWPGYRDYFQRLELWQTIDPTAVGEYLIDRSAPPTLLKPFQVRYGLDGNERIKERTENE